MSVKQSGGGRERGSLGAAALSLVPVAEPIRSPAIRELDRLLGEISGDTAALNLKLIAAVRLLAGLNAWTELIRLLIGVGGYQLAEIAQATGVMRSTVTRWFNGETSPSRDQVDVYLERLVAHMQPSRPFELKVESRSFVIGSDGE